MMHQVFTLTCLQLQQTALEPQINVSLKPLSHCAPRAFSKQFDAISDLLSLYSSYTEYQE